VSIAVDALPPIINRDFFAFLQRTLGNDAGARLIMRKLAVLTVCDTIGRTTMIDATGFVDQFAVSVVGVDPNDVHHCMK
jgi:hypothetical protein